MDSRGLPAESNPPDAYADTNAPATTSTPMTASNAWQNTKEGASNAWQSTKEGATNAWEATKTATVNAWQSTKNALGDGFSTNDVSTNYFGYDYSSKDAYLTQARLTLDDLDQRASSLSNRLASASDSTKADLQPTLQALSDKRGELNQKYDDIKNASQDNWNDVKAAFAKSYYDLKADLKAAWDTLKSKM